MAQGKSEPGDSRKRGGRRRYSYLRRPSCLNATEDHPDNGAGADRSAVLDGGIPVDRPVPTHLVVMINGIVGRSVGADPFVSFALLVASLVLDLFVCFHLFLLSSGIAYGRFWNQHLLILLCFSSTDMLLLLP